MAIYGTPVVHPGREYERELWSNVTKPFEFNTTITASALADIWSPSAKKFVLKGFELTAIVRAAFVAANPRILMFFDNSTATPVCSAGMAFEAAAPIGVWYATSRDLREGIPSATAGNILKLGFNGSIGAGVLSVGGVVWGEEL